MLFVVYVLLIAHVFASVVPTTSPTVSPTSSPTMSPTISPTSSPTVSPTDSPTISPTPPTPNPTPAPSVSPTPLPSSSPTLPTPNPTPAPSTSPSVSPTLAPTVKCPGYYTYYTNVGTSTGWPFCNINRPSCNSGDDATSGHYCTSGCNDIFQCDVFSINCAHCNPTSTPTRSPTISPTEAPTVTPPPFIGSMWYYISLFAAGTLIIITLVTPLIFSKRIKIKGFMVVPIQE